MRLELKPKTQLHGIMLSSADYSAGGSGPLKKLPGWIQQSLVATGSFGEAFGRLHKFARNMHISEQS